MSVSPVLRSGPATAWFHGQDVVSTPGANLVRCRVLFSATDRIQRLQASTNGAYWVIGVRYTSIKNLFFTLVVTHLSLAQLAERETVVFTAISRSSVRLREGRLLFSPFPAFSKKSFFFRASLGHPFLGPSAS